MRRTTALVLLVGFVLAGSTPWVQALSGVQPHACCLRRLHPLGGHELQFSSPPDRSHNCCPPLTAPHSAVIARPDTSVPNWAGGETSSRDRALSLPEYRGVGFS